MTTIAQQLDNVLALAEKATPGPWHVDGAYCPKHETETRAIYHTDRSAGHVHGVYEVVETGCGCEDQAISQIDADLITAAVNFIREHGPAIRAAVGRDDPAYDFRWERDLSEGLSEYGYEAFVEGCPKDATRVIPLYRHPRRSGR